MKKKVLITGAGGLIGLGLASHIKNHTDGVKITGVTSSKKNINNFDNVITALLGQPMNIPKQEYDAIVHCAFDKNEKSNILNTSGTIKWADEAEKAGIKVQIFMSSISSQSDFLSSYGSSKKQLEKWFLSKGHYVLRLGLVIANGGMFGRLVNSISASPVIPLIGGGKYMIFPTDPEMIFDLVKRIIERDIIQPDKTGFNLQFKKGVRLKNILQILKHRTGKRPILIPVPYFLAYSLLKIAGLFKFLKMDIDTGNLKGMKWNSRISMRSDIYHLGYSERSLSEMIKNIEI